MAWLINKLGGKLMAYGLIAAVMAVMAGGWAYKYYSKGVRKERGLWTVQRNDKQNELDRSVIGVEQSNGNIDLNLKQNLNSNTQKFGGNE